MRPISLSMEYFGSYVNKTEINFDDLTEPIFLITGDTGAGKSTIFDAMVFALYGKSASSSGRDGVRDFKSQYEDKMPIVTFKFEKNNKEYIVTRTYAKNSDKDEIKNTKGVVKIMLTLPDNTVITAKGEAEEKIVEIVGLTKEQFTQIAMLAQGEFMAILRAKTSDKRKIFRYLFHTEKYEKIIEAIRKKCKKYEEELGKANALCKKDVERVKLAENSEQIYEEILNLKREITTAKEFNIVDLERFMELLEKNLKQVESEKNTIEESVKTLKKEVENLKGNYIKNEELKKNFDALNVEELKLKELVKDEKDIENFKKLAVEIVKAFEINDKFKIYENAEEKVKKIERNLEEEEKKLPIFEAEFNKNLALLKTAETEEKKETPILQSTIERAQNAIKIFGEIKETEKNIVRGNAESQKIARELEKLKVEIEEKNKQVESLIGIEGRKEKLKNEEQKLNDFTDICKEISTAEKEINEETKTIKKLQKEYETKRDSYKKKEDEYISKETLFFDSQAGVLAKKLEKNSPCPVCGSLEHPSPAKFVKGEVKKEDLDLLKKAANSEREKTEKIARELEGKIAALDEKKKGYNAKIEDAKSYIENSDIEEISVKYLREIYKTLKNELDRQNEILKKDELTLKEAKAFLSSGEKLKTELENKLMETTKQVSTLNGVLENLIKSKTFDDLAFANKALKEAKQKLKVIEENLITLRAKKDETKSKFEKSKTLIEEYKNNLPNVRKELKNAREIYEALKEKHDLSEEEWKKIVDVHNKEDSDKLNEKVSEFYNKKSLIFGSVNTLKNKTEGKTVPDLESLKNAVLEKENILNENENKLNSFRENFSNNKEAFNSLKSEKKSREEIQKTYKNYDRLYNRLSSNASGERLDIETFAQRYYLSEILSYANSRLKIMTDGEYELRLVDEKIAKAQQNRGLDLMVYSNLIGKTREIKTLSGGESFLTALSLSLGMADATGRRAMALSPDILFIDEGFGSLDENARHEAIDALKKVAGERRLIAVISHVPELKREVETRLLVTKDDKGSSIKWEN